MRTLGNVVWIIFGGLISALSWVFTGLLMCITIIGIPFGKQCFKIAELSLAPFGKNVNTDFNKHPIANVIWMFLFGWELFLFNILTGVMVCITIIGIPFGKQWFKLAFLALIPFGTTIK